MTPELLAEVLAELQQAETEVKSIHVEAVLVEGPVEQGWATKLDVGERVVTIHYVRKP